MKAIFTTIILFLACISMSQNLVQNGSFEQYTVCPSALGQMSRASSWSTPTGGSPDYFHMCAPNHDVLVPSNQCGWQMPVSGQAYAGLLLFFLANSNGREYIQGQLTTTLIANQAYRFEMSACKANYSQKGTDAIGVYFSPSGTAVAHTTLLNVSPQIVNAPGNFINDTANWVLVSSSFTATGGEKYFIIGNFNTDANTTTTLTSTTYGSANTGYVYIDDVSLTLDNTTGLTELPSNQEIKIYPNPVTDMLNINCPDNGKLFLYDMMGKTLIERQITAGKNVIDVSCFSEGLYFLNINTSKGSSTFKVVR
jgi:hypothetical protein